MNNKEIGKDAIVLASLEAQYKHVRCLVDSVRATITDLNFEDMVPDADERFLMGGQLHAYEVLQDNLKARIRLYRNRIKANKPEPWEENNAIRTVNTHCGPVNLVNQDKVSKEELGEMIHHCGQDAGSPCGCSAVAYDPNESQPVDLDDACCQVREHQPAGYAYKDLLGMEVMFVFPRCHKCEYCTFREGHDGSECPCVKVELVGGDYLCLAKRPKQKQTIISFDEEEGNMMDDIKEKTEAFMNYLDSVVKD